MHCSSNRFLSGSLLDGLLCGFLDCSARGLLLWFLVLTPVGFVLFLRLRALSASFCLFLFLGAPRIINLRPQKVPLVQKIPDAQTLQTAFGPSKP